MVRKLKTEENTSKDNEVATTIMVVMFMFEVC